MSFQQGLSGLSAASKNLEVIGNNISNANTIGAKSSRAEFSDLYASAVGGGGSVGIGTRVAAITQDHTQGSITTTGGNLDLAINGSGYFQVLESSSARGGAADKSVLYSRNGQFKSDREGNIVNNEGMKLLGYSADESGAIRTGQLEPLRIPEGRMQQQATSKIDLGFNLNAADTVKTLAFDQNEGGSFNYSTSMKIVDQSGKEVQMGLYYKKTASNTWDVFVTANGALVPGATGNAVGTLSFTNPDGSGPPAPASITVTGASLAGVLNSPANTALGLSYTFPDIDMNLRETTQRAGDYLVGNLSQDGYPAGTLNSFSFDKSGVMTARYSNGEVRQTGQLALATFRNPQGLTPAGGNAWAESRDAGAKSIDVPGGGAAGEISAGALEDSNVDLTAELVSLITAQRTYQANAQTIKAQDQVMQTFVNMR